MTKEFIKITKENIQTVPVTNYNLYRSKLSNATIIEIFKNGTLGNKPIKQSVLENFFFQRLVRYDFHQLGELLPGGLVRINAAMIFLRVIEEDKHLTETDKKLELFNICHTYVMNKVDYRDEWRIKGIEYLLERIKTKFHSSTRIEMAKILCGTDIETLFEKFDRTALPAKSLYLELKPLYFTT